MSILRSAFLAAVAGAALVTSAHADELAGTVAGKLKESGTLSGYRVNVKAKSGTVWLEGRVADSKQLAAAVSIAENTPGVERVVNRLTIGRQGDAAGGAPTLGLPNSIWGTAGVPKPASEARAATPPSTPPSMTSPATRGLLGLGGQEAAGVQLTQALAPTPRPVAMTTGGPVGMPTAQGGRPPAGPRSNTPRPLGAQTARAMQPSPPPGRQQPLQRTAMRGPAQRTSMRGGGMDPMHLPAPGGYEGPMQGGPVADGQMVPGSMRIVDGGGEGGYANGGYADGGPAAGGYASGGPAGGGALGAPMPMGGTGVGLPPVPGRGDGPNMPNYAWPSYSASPNYAAVQYPTQYSPTAWPYIGPFYPYPQVPLGWRRVSLEWDDGWWWLDFDERHIHSHHR